MKKNESESFHDELRDSLRKFREIPSYFFEKNLIPGPLNSAIYEHGGLEVVLKEIPNECFTGPFSGSGWKFLYGRFEHMDKIFADHFAVSSDYKYKTIIRLDNKLDEEEIEFWEKHKLSYDFINNLTKFCNNFYKSAKKYLEIKNGVQKTISFYHNPRS